MARRAVVTFRTETALGGAAALLRSVFKTSMFLDRTTTTDGLVSNHMVHINTNITRPLTFGLSTA